MKRTVVLMASPRLQSNTDILVNQVIEGIRTTAGPDDRIDKINLVELQSFVCCACGQCQNAGRCLQFPEVTEKLEMIRQADGLVIATPVWWLGPSSYLKIFMDHWGAFLRPDYTSRIAGKRAALIACCGNPSENLAEKVCDDLGKILSFLGVTVRASLSVKGVASYGAVADDAQSLASAFALGEAFYR
ncbi:MAG: flavodoxin family protein [Desulfopila sp.]